MRKQDKQVSTTTATFQIPQLFSTIAWNLSGAKNVAFTMAEILLSLTIIGVVAAITLPSLTGNINERTWNTQRKALYARISQAISLMPAINSFGSLSEDETVDSTTAPVAERLITDGLSKVLKINNICDAKHLGDCGITSKFIDLDATAVESFPQNILDFNSNLNGAISEGNGITYYNSNYNTIAAAFETQNGESILVYYNPACETKEVNVSAISGISKTQNKVCANFIYDLNGKKGPNTANKDIGFISVLYPSDSIVVMPYPSPKNQTGTASQTNGAKYCRSLGDEYRMPNLEELMAMSFNKPILGAFGNYYWPSTIVKVGSETKSYLVSLSIGYASLRHPITNGARIWCVKR